MKACPCTERGGNRRERDEPAAAEEESRAEGERDDGEIWTERRRRTRTLVKACRSEMTEERQRAG